MKRLLVLLPAALVVLTGCGDTCSTKPAELDSTAASCTGATLAAGAQVTITAALHCQTCSETDASCVGEVTGSNALEIDAQFRECDSNKNCGAPACQVPRPTVSCRLTTPAVSGTVPFTLQYVSGTGLQTVNLNVGTGGGAGCTL